MITVFDGFAGDFVRVVVTLSDSVTAVDLGHALVSICAREVLMLTPNSFGILTLPPVRTWNSILFKREGNDVFHFFHAETLGSFAMSHARIQDSESSLLRACTYLHFGRSSYSGAVEVTQKPSLTILSRDRQLLRAGQQALQPRSHGFKYR